MSFPVVAEHLNDEERARIAKELEIVPTVPPSFGKGVQQSAAPPFGFYTHEGENIKLPLSFARELFGAESVPGEFAWGKLSSSSVRLPMRSHQVSIIEEAKAHLIQHSTTTIQVPPGTGKTIMAISIAVVLGLKFAIVFPRSTLQSQWTKSIARVILGDDNPACLKEAASFICEPSQAAVEARATASGKAKKGARAVSLEDFQAIVALGERAASVPKEMRAQVGTLIIDEAHLCCVPSLVPALLAFSPRYVIALTATLERSDGAHQMIRHLAGWHEVFRRPTRPYKVIAFQTGIPIRETLNRVTKLLDYTQYCNDLALNEEFSKAIVDVVVANATRKFVILFTRVDHAERVSAAIREKGVSSEVMCGARKMYTDCRALCGTFGKISTGFDASTFATDFDGEDPDTLILVNGVKQSATFAQSAGRIMRARKDVTPAVVWMLTHNAVSTRHLSGMRKFIRENGGEVLKANTLAGVNACFSTKTKDDTAPPGDIASERQGCRKGAQHTPPKTG